MTDPKNTPGTEPAAAPTNEEALKAFEEKFSKIEEQNQTLVREMNKLLRERAEDKDKLTERELALQNAVSQLSRVNQRPTMRDEVMDAIERARAEQDPVKEAQLSAKLAAIEATEASLKGMLGMSQTIASHLASSLTPEERTEFYRDIYVNGDPNQGFKSMELMQSFGLLGPQLAENARARVIHRKYASGDLAREIEQKIREADAAKDAAMKTQLGVTHPSGTVPAPGEPNEPQETYEERVRREVREAGEQERGIMRHPAPK